MSIKKTDLILDPTVIANRTEILSCPAVGIPTPTLTWYKDGVPLDLRSLQHMRLLQVSKGHAYKPHHPKMHQKKDWQTGPHQSFVWYDTDYRFVIRSFHIFDFIHH